MLPSVPACAHDVVQFVNKEDYSALRLSLDLRQHGLKAFLKLSPVLGAGYQRAMSSEKIVFSLRPSGTSPRTICAGPAPSAMAVLPPSRFADQTGCSLSLRERIRITFLISASRPMTGSISCFPLPAPQGPCRISKARRTCFRDCRWLPARS